MDNAHILKKEKGTKNSTPDSVKNQVKDNEFKITKSNYFVKRIILNRKEIQILLSNSINSLEDIITNDNNRIGSILKNKKKNIENLLIKKSLK